MSPTRYSRFAERAFPIRWWLGASSGLGFVLVALLAAFAGRVGIQAAAVIAGPLIGLPWAALCAAMWFHPQHGKIQASTALVGRFPRPVQLAIRWYGALFLSLFVVVCGIVWPLFALNAIRS